MKRQALSDLDTVELTTDRPGERLFVHSLRLLPSVQMWTVRASDRLWAMHHETFTACLVLAPGELRATWRYRGRERIITASNIQLMEPGELHVTTRTSQPASFFVVWWQPTFVQELAAEMGYPGALHLRTCQSGDPEFVQSLLLTYQAVQNEDAEAAQANLLEATELLIDRCGTTTGRSASAVKFHPGVARARVLLNERFSERVTLDELAKAAGLSKYHFVRSFRQECGLAPHAYQNLRRVADAKLRIERGESIKEAAVLSGFSDQAHFSRTFKRVVGVPPGAWSRAVRRWPFTALPLPGGA